jgi:flagellar hook-basal body complex protein FliE
MGDRSVSLAEAMIASQKSSVAFEATVQVRNKLVESYKEIMNMPV